MKHTDIIQKLNLEQKCALLSGETVFTTRALPGKGIPAITLSDGPNGVRKQAGAADHLGLNPSVPATCFPTSSATACSWDEKLGEAVGEALGEEAAAQEVAVLLGPGLNIQRSPLCGRDFEYFSEDPILAGRMAAAYVRGIQKNGISACPKHFAVNSQELRRMASDSVLDERTLRELYLTGFEIVVKEAKPKTIMTSYNLINGTYANENAHLLQDILRKDWGFDGAVVTDWGGSNDHALGVKNGSTLEMPCPGGDSIRELMKAVQDGKISEADVDAHLDEMLELVLSTHAAVEKAPRTFDAAAHHKLARRAAAESIVLLKNEGGILPLKPNEKLAVIGDFAETPRYQGAGPSAANAPRASGARRSPATSARSSPISRLLYILVLLTLRAEIKADHRRVDRHIVLRERPAALQHAERDRQRDRHDALDRKKICQPLERQLLHPFSSHPSQSCPLRACLPQAASNTMPPAVPGSRVRTSPVIPLGAKAFVTIKCLPTKFTAHLVPKATSQSKPRSARTALTAPARRVPIW